MTRELRNIACFSVAWLWIVSAVSAEEPPVRVPQTREAIIMQNLYRLEKAFLVRACQLSEEQKREVQVLDNSWIEAVPKPMPGAQRIDHEVEVVIRNQARGNVVFDARDVAESVIHAYRTALRDKFAKILTPAQRQTYVEELAARDEFKRQADTQCLVALLDDALDLEPEQREDLMKTLALWPHKEKIYIAHFFQSHGTLPVIPEDLLAKHLTPEQLALYRGFLKTNVRRSSALALPQHEAFGE